MDLNLLLRDHPRTCGDKSAPVVRPPGALGSPPHLRGKVVHKLNRAVVPGITPAHAGKSLSGTGALRLRRDHPRVCGEKDCLALLMAACMGSPPRMRGKERRDRQAARRAGITPAYAGKSRLPVRPYPNQRDHPCTCGEKCTLMLRRRLTVGSLPHMRGKANEGEIQLNWAGITPAHAGKRIEQRIRDYVSEDHPRVCGEKFLFCRGAMGAPGSPPRMRGKVLFLNVGDSVAGITPAYAGKRDNEKIRWHIGRDHPRACGEKAFSISLSGQSGGSPPRMRGKVKQCLILTRFGGITPAHAGKRSSVSTMRA